MARIELVPEVQGDFDRILDHLVSHGAAEAKDRVLEIMQAIEVLATNPLIGRQVKDRNRELIIGRRTQAYVALYRYIEEFDVVLVLAVGSQREGGYQRP